MQIDIMGGEPLLMEWMPDFIRAAIRRGFSVNLSTNGSRAEILMELKDVPPSKFIAGISLEGDAAERHDYLTGSSNFQRTVQNLRLLVSHGFDPLVKTVVSTDTKESLQKIADLLRDIGVSRHFLIHMDVLSRDETIISKGLGYVDFLTCFESLKAANPGREIFKVHASCFSSNMLPANTRCAGGVLKLSLLPDGSVFPCNLFHTMSGFYLGNIFRDDFSAIWNHPKLAFFREFRGNNCPREDCSNRIDCTGGCPALSCFHYGAVDGPDIRCMQRSLPMLPHFA
jgi:radical SAM protein with 4Fe4S-binding SPASM domain